MFKPATLIDPKTKQRVAVRSEEDAQRYFGMGYQLETSTPPQQEQPTSPALQQVQPTARRTDTGVETLVQSPLRDMQSQTKFLDIVKEAIQKQQTAQQPLTEQKAYWRTMQRDITPFGSARPPEEVGGLETDRAFREMSPADQASIRQARYTAAGAHLKGIREEEEYRGTRLEDTIKSITDMMSEQDKLSKNELYKAEKALDIMKKKAELGLPLTDKDYESVGQLSTDGRTGGSISWRFNNPLNLKYKDWQKQYGAKPGKATADGRVFAVFPSVEKAHEAYRALLEGKTYKDLTLDAAMKLWSGGGYGDEILEMSTTMQNVLNTPELYQRMVTNMQQREGWTEGTMLGTGQTAHKYWTEQQVKKLALKIGKTFDELWNDYTDAGLDTLSSQFESSMVEDVISRVDSRKLLNMGISNVDDLRTILTLKYVLKAKDDEIYGLLNELGISTKTQDGFPILDEIDLLINPM